MELWESIPEQISVLGTWSGIEDDLMAKLRELNYVCRIQTDGAEEIEIMEAVLDVVGAGEDEPARQPRPDMLAVLGPHHWETYVIGKGDIVFLRGNGNLSYGSESSLGGNFRKVTDIP